MRLIFVPIYRIILRAFAIYEDTFLLLLLLVHLCKSFTKFNKYY